MRQLQTYLDVGGLPVPVGTGYVTVGRTAITTSFVYEPGYLANAASYGLDPGLPRQAGQQHVEGLPGCWRDSAPDRWGRNLIDKRRRTLQRTSPRRLPSATGVDYLLSVSDLTRQGALRFTEDGNVFLDPGHMVPKLVTLPALLRSADLVVSGSEDDWIAVKELLDAGSGSLGGARPKASVRGDDGALLIAKFPHRSDAWDVMAWEKTVLDLAEEAGLHTPVRQLASVGGRRVLLLERFDRGPGDVRHGYISAMTMLGARDGDERDYADIATALPESGSRVKRDLAELFSRVVFSVAVHNTDDHLRNHGFLHSGGGWRLSPLFDVNPNPDLGARRVTSVLGAVDADEEVEALMDLAQECRLSRHEALAAVDRICRAVRQWRAVAAANGIASTGREMFAEAFEHQLTSLARLT